MRSVRSTWMEEADAHPSQINSARDVRLGHYWIGRDGVRHHLFFVGGLRNYSIMLMVCHARRSGKTASFALPVLHKMLESEGKKGIYCLVLAPTRFKDHPCIQSVCCALTSAAVRFQRTCVSNPRHI